MVGKNPNKGSDVFCVWKHFARPCSTSCEQTSLAEEVRLCDGLISPSCLFFFLVGAHFGHYHFPQISCMMFLDGLVNSVGANQTK